MKKIGMLLAALFTVACSSSPAVREKSEPVVFNNDDLVLWAFSDIQPRNENEHKDFEIAVDDIASMKNIDASLCGGDIVQSGEDIRAADTYKWFYKNYGRSGIKNIFEIAGNHDARNIEAYLKGTGKPLHYSVRYGNLIIMMLSDEADSSGTDISDGAFQWWKSTVENNRDKIIITYTHSHLGGSGFIYNLISYRNVQIPDRFTEVLKREKVELWLCGHTHVPSFLGLSKRQISSLNNTVFMNTAAIREDYFFSDAESRMIILKNGSDKMTVKIRNHRELEFKSCLEQTIDLKTKFLYNGEKPVVEVYKP